MSVMPLTDDTRIVSGIADAGDANCLVSDTLCFVVLAGDVNGDGVVNTSDFVRRGRGCPLRWMRIRSPPMSMPTVWLTCWISS